MTILSAINYPTIRAVLRADLSSDDLPDATIDLFIGSADREVTRLVPAWADATGADLESLTDAAIYLTAERIVMAIPTVMKISGYGFSEEVSDTSPTARAAQLRAMAYAELLPLGVTRASSYGFAVQVARSDGYSALDTL